MSVNGPIEIPNKSSFKVNEVCALTGVKSYVLRFWESEFEEIAPQTTDDGLRFYNQNDIEAILLIKKLLFEDKLTIERAKSQLKLLVSRSSQFVNSHIDSLDDARDLQSRLSSHDSYFGGSGPVEDVHSQEHNEMDEYFKPQAQESLAKVEDSNHLFNQGTEVNTPMITKDHSIDLDSAKNPINIESLELAKQKLFYSLNLIEAIKVKNHWT